MQPRLRIKVLAREAQVAGDGARYNLGLTEGQIGGLPDHGSGGGDEPLRGAEVVIDKIIGAGGALVFPQGQRFAVGIDILSQYGFIKADFGDKLVVQVVEVE
jgi:hypothetical protein